MRGILPLALLLARPATGGHLPLLALRGGAFNPLLQAAAAYGNALASSPLSTNVATAATLSVISDGVAQRIAPLKDTTDRPATWDVARSAWIFVWGAAVSGYVFYHWFGLLATLYPDARTSLRQLLLKVFTNQLVLSPCSNAGFFAFVILTRMRPYARMSAPKWAALRQKLRADLGATILRSNYYWTCVQLFNFRVLPARYTVLSTNLFFLLWTVYLCIVGNRAVTAVTPADEGRAE